MPPSQPPRTLALALATLPERRQPRPTPKDQVIHAQHLFWQHQRATTSVSLQHSHASLAVPLPTRRRPLE